MWPKFLQLPEALHSGFELEVKTHMEAQRASKQEAVQDKVGEQLIASRGKPVDLPSEDSVHYGEILCSHLKSIGCTDLKSG